MFCVKQLKHGGVSTSQCLPDETGNNEYIEDNPKTWLEWQVPPLDYREILILPIK